MAESNIKELTGEYVILKKKDYFKKFHWNLSEIYGDWIFINVKKNNGSINWHLLGFYCVQDT